MPFVRRRARDVAGLGRAGALALGVAWLAGCGGGSSGGSPTSPSTSVAFGTPGPNVQPIVVDAGPANNYANGAFTSVTVCVPGTASCRTIDGVLVDTGSSGLRLLSSQVGLSLPAVQDPSGAALVECNQFQDSYQWGPLVKADVKIAGEAAPAVPIQLIGDPGYTSVPADCASSGLPSQDTVDTLGANGILGVGLWRQDCGPACARAGSTNPGLYYACSGSGCQVTAAALDKQAQNPVWMFASDNNGVAIQLPSVPQLGAPGLQGSLVFGIATRSNNSASGAVVYTVDGVGDITTVFGGRSYPASFIDSGSNALYFLDSATAGMPTCRGAAFFYCPSAPASLQAQNRGANGTGGSIAFSVLSANTLFAGSNLAFDDLAGPNAGGFDWGLPFFFGRVVFTAIEQQATPLGPGPYFAY